MTIDYETLKVLEDNRGVVRVALNRPEKHNALSAQMIGDLTDLAERLTPEHGRRAVVLSGEGKTFCAGGDLGWMQEQVRADRDGRIAAARQLAYMLKAWNEVPLPVIGRLHGGAYGGGIGLACVCDTAIASTETRFGLTETRLGLIPATIGPYVIARLGEGAARRVFLSSRVFDVEEALRLGIVAAVADHADLDAAIEAEVEPYLHVAPGAVASAKALARELGPPIDDATIEATVRRLADTWEGEEAAHGISAFLSRTPPRWA